jgi:hypothetical protein
VGQQPPYLPLQIDKLIPTSWSDATVEGVNTAIPGWVQAHSTSQSPVVIADCSRAAGFTNAMLESDGVHPNSQGDQFIAKQIGPKLIQLINDVRAGTGNPSTTAGTPVTLTTSTTSSSQPTGGNCAALYGQCGGQGYTGSTCCSQGSCKVSNNWYSQCL